MSGQEPPRPFEPERYEQWERLPYHFEADRREFLQLLGGVLVLVAASEGRAQESGMAAPGGPSPADIAAWLNVAEDGSVTVFTGKVEVGQNIRTSLTQAVAEELGTPPGSIRLVMGQTDRAPFDLGTFGSRTTPMMGLLLRKVAATAREMLKELAARQWSVPASELEVGNGQVAHAASRRALSFGALTKDQKLTRILHDDVPLNPAERWKVAGQSLEKIGGSEIVSGRHRYTSDLTRPGLWHGRVLRPPAIGATLASLDATAAQAMADVVVVRDGDFAGVAAAHAPLAAKALEALRPQWNTTPQPSGRELFELLRKPPASPPPRGEGGRVTPHRAGSVPEALAAAALRHEATYTVAYIAHVPLEPRAAVAEWNEGRLTVWTGTQRPFGVRSELAEALRVKEDAVRVLVPDTGSAYGGKHTGESAVEAARLAKAAGKPVKVVWTREEEFRWAYFRPAGVIEVRSGASPEGKLLAWDFHNYNSGGSGIQTPYDIPNQLVEFHAADSPLRQGSYRGLAATANHFARESHMDELAAELKLDPLELRRRNLKEPRLRAVLDAAAERFGWGKSNLEAGHGQGIACGMEKGGYVATCAEIQVEVDGNVRVRRLVTAFECGAILNPEHLRNQVEGGMLMGLGGALFEAIGFDEGQISNSKLSLYRVPRFSDMPEVDVVLLDRKDLPSAGAGETPIIAVAPAVAGAIFRASGVRLRSLPLVPKGLPKPSEGPARATDSKSG
jgi:isoquinoline 1-oxidoreductase